MTSTMATSSQRTPSFSEMHGALSLSLSPHPSNLRFRRYLSFQGNLARRPTLPRPLHIQAGALYRTRRRPARSRGRRLRFRLREACLPRPLDGPRLRMDRSGERALCFPHRKGRARWQYHRTHRRIHPWHPLVRSLFFFFLYGMYVCSTRILSRSPENFECSIKPRSKDAEALIHATATA